MKHFFKTHRLGPVFRWFQTWFALFCKSRFWVGWWSVGCCLSKNRGNAWPQKATDYREKSLFWDIPPIVKITNLEHEFTMIVLHSFLDKPREKKQFVLHGSVVGCRCNEKRSPKNHCVYLLMVELSPLELSSLQPLSRGKDSIMEFHDQMWSNDNFNHCNTKVTNIKSASTFLLACFGVICSHHFGLSVKPFKNGVLKQPWFSWQFQQGTLQQLP